MGCLNYRTHFWDTSYACGICGMDIRAKRCVVHLILSFILNTILEVFTNKKIIPIMVLFFSFCSLLIIQTGSYYTSIGFAFARLLEGKANKFKIDMGENSILNTGVDICNNYSQNSVA